MTLKEKLAKLDTDAEKRALVYKYALRTIKNKNSMSKFAKIDPSKEPEKQPSFKELYAKAKTPQERDRLIYQYAIRQPPPKMVPVTVSTPDKRKITFMAMQDFFTIDGIRVSPSPPIAQRIALHFGMALPTAKMADIVYKNSNQVPAKPLSGSGVEIDGKTYSAQDVVDKLISDPRATIAYNDIVNSQLAGRDKTNDNKPVDGFAKSIVQPEAGKENRAAYYGIWSTPGGKPTQGGNGTTPHGLTQQEYITFLRGIDNGNVTVTSEDGTVEHTTLDKALEDKTLASSLTFSPGSGSRSYVINSQKKGPPPGFRSAQLPQSIIEEAQGRAKSLLNRPLGSEITITLSNGVTYVARKEKHGNKPTGISIYEPKNSVSSNSKPVATSTPSSAGGEVAQNAPVTPQRKSIMTKITDFINNLSQGLG